ncbi:methyltransferase family protein [Stackebrandtia endophytica]|uniref:Methyltransferase family protein n=1 Tax=Stackebrandtia endophytica TaxID=1496996 RepID=A0A543B3F5_9ACTN|nr:class I SAM-dependent methyltransferase [Stackebrandtia endophytica]TQL79368.1 methyltransferase family protein [Stackebrandtia endophytica]
MSSRPAPWSAFTTPQFWDDPHISQRMLAAHLDPEGPAASRPHAFIDRSVDWLIPALGLSSGSRLLDLGCGPGLYANRIASRGIEVVGVDASRRSISHARSGAESGSFPARFVVGDYLSASLGDGYDAVILIFEDYCALSPRQRSVLLNRVGAALSPGGRFLFDVTAAPRFETFSEGTETAAQLMDGFWAAQPYVGTRTTWRYPVERLVLERYTIRTADGTRRFWNWTHCLTADEVGMELAAAGFDTPQWFGDVAGADYDPDRDVFAVIAAHQRATESEDQPSARGTTGGRGRVV